MGKSISVSVIERLTQLENENKLLSAALEEIAKETGTPYADTAQKALDEVRK